MLSLPYSLKHNMDDKLSQLRRVATEATNEGLEGWRTKWAMLEGIADGVLGIRDRPRSGTNIMAKKLTAYYMRQDGYPYNTIGGLFGQKTHVTARKHALDCEFFLSIHDRAYTLAHRRAKEMGIW